MRFKVSFPHSRLILAACTAALLVVSLSSCQTLSYYSQAAGGQLSMWRAAEPIDELLRDEETDPALRQRLELVSAIRAFATDELGLPDNGSYRSYADLKRPYALWNVFAAPQLSLEPVTWCFPIAGCVAYRGYFSEKAAQRFADGLRQRNFDVYVGGVPAYSTLGWFDDAVLNTFIGYPDPELASLIFHELAHQVAYAPGDTTFNESFATAVELEGVRRWLIASARSTELTAFESALGRHQDFVTLVTRTQDVLQEIFKANISDAEKLKRKVNTYSGLRAEYHQLKQTWGGFSGYDRWFEDPLNNAKLGSVAAYNQLVPAFQKMLADSGGDLAAFYKMVIALTKLPADERRAQLGASEATCADCASGPPDLPKLSLFQ